MGSVAIVFYYDKRLRYSINALVASIDLIEGLDVYLVEDQTAFLNTIRYVARRYRGRCIVAYSILSTSLVDENYLSFIIGSVSLAKKSNCITIVGGPHASGDPIGCIESLGFDYVFIGEAEYSLRKFLETIRDKGDPLDTPGLFTRIEGKYVSTRRPPPIVLDSHHPFPYWRYLFNPIEITRGCMFECKYCQVPYLHGFKLRHRSVDSIFRYADIMVSYGVRDLRFISPNSFSYGSINGKLNVEAIEELLSKLYLLVREKNARIFFGSFPSEVRPEYVTEEVVRVLRKYIHNREVIIGAQTGSNRLLEEIRRGHTLEDVFNAVEILNKYGFRASIDYIIGLPGETEDDLKETLDSIKKLVKLGARIHLHTFMPLPGSPYAYKNPQRIPQWFRREISRIIGMGRAYGEWIHQEKIAWKLVELREKGIILPRRRIERIKIR
ncbi:MAG: B12-binding domain/radical SAM domain-containing protein [Desulfurococcales archaeon ex4484_58]|nr:MAG: B12-binding domain/radical SAM domain-containing protein [Desulfurococcales archaeon ex4484_58]